MRIKYRRFESEAARLFGLNNSLETLHTKNVDEASILCSVGCSGIVSAGACEIGQQETRTRFRVLALEYADQGLIFRSVDQSVDQA